MTNLSDEPATQSGFGNYFASEAREGALPIGRNSPQRVPFGLYAELISGTAFTAPRCENRRTWLYRKQPTANHPRYERYADGALFTHDFASLPADPNRMRWDPLPKPDEPMDFVDGMVTFVGNGGPGSGTGIAAHIYSANASMDCRAFCNADGEMLIVPETGRLSIVTEMGILHVAPLQIALIPRGVRFRVDLIDATARGYVCENFGAPFRLPELGPIGSNGLANPRDFEAPVAAFETRQAPCQIIHKYGGSLWTMTLDHSPFDVVAWHGNLAPLRYDLRRFNVINTVSFDHPDPSIFTVLTSPSETHGTANCDFVIFPPRWMVAEDTFRPPWFHRNVMSEYMGLITGAYDAKEAGFTPGGGSLHNCMTAHGPDRTSHEAAIVATLEPNRIKDTMAFMFESRLPLRMTGFAERTLLAQKDYDACWSGLDAAGQTQ